jgi:hypothetical protein
VTSPRRNWPAGLRALFWASGVGLAIEAAHLYWFGIRQDELGPPPSLQGMSALVAFTLGVVIVGAGVWAKRRALVLVAYAKAVLSGGRPRSSCTTYQPSGAVYGAGRRGARRIWFGLNPSSPGVVVVVSSASIQ